MRKTDGTLGLHQGVALYVGAVLGTGILFLPAVAAQTAGPGSLLAWLAMIVLSAPIALTYAALSRARPDAAGFSASIARAFGADAGAVSGWLFLSQVPTGTVVVTLAAGQYAAAALGEGWVIPAGIVLIGSGLVLNWIGLGVSANVQLAALAVLVVGIAIVLSRALVSIRPSEFSPFLPFGVFAIGLAAVQLFWAFVGWEAITPLADQFRKPNDIWRASIITLVLVGLLYLAVALATIGNHAYGHGASGLADVAQLAIGAFGHLAAPIVGLGGWLLTFPTVNAYLAGLSRLAAAMSRRHELPRWLGVTANGIPRRALAATGVVVLAALVVLVATRLDIARVLPLTAANFIIIYVLSMAAAARLLTGAYRAVAVIAAVSCACVLVFLGWVLLWPLGIAVLAIAYRRLTDRE